MAISDNRIGKYKPSGGQLRDFIVGTGQVIYNQVLVGLTASGDLVPLIDNVTDTVALCVGVAVLSGGEITGDGSLTARVDIGGAEILVDHDTGSLTIANIGDSVLSGTDEGSVDDATGSGDDVPVGVIINVPSATTCWVKCRPYGTQS